MGDHESPLIAYEKPSEDATEITFEDVIAMYVDATSDEFVEHMAQQIGLNKLTNSQLKKIAISQTLILGDLKQGPLGKVKFYLNPHRGGVH
jgi:NADPH-dependent 7-cyano-7-deazaguanine reductase QueF-like protein